MPEDLVRLIEGLALHQSRPAVAAVARQAAVVAEREGWPVPFYAPSTRSSPGLDPHLHILAHDRPAALRDRYELVYRRQAEGPNVLWQADHTQLDMLVTDTGGRPARPWLTVVLDDHSRAVAGRGGRAGRHRPRPTRPKPGLTANYIEGLRVGELDW